MLLRDIKNHSDRGTKYVVTVDGNSKIVDTLLQASLAFPDNSTIHDNLGPVYTATGHRLGSISKLQDPRSERQKFIDFLVEFKINYRVVEDAIVVDACTIFPDHLTFAQVKAEPGWTVEGNSVRYRNIVCTSDMQWRFVHGANYQSQLQFPPRTLTELRLLMARAQ